MGRPANADAVKDRIFRTKFEMGKEFFLKSAEGNAGFRCFEPSLRPRLFLLTPLAKHFAANT